MLPRKRGAIVGRDFTPERLDASASDATPGWRPATLAAALNKVARGACSILTFKVTSDVDFTSASAENSIACLLRLSAVSLHWVCVVQVESGFV